MKTSIRILSCLTSLFMLLTGFTSCKGKEETIDLEDAVKRKDTRSVYSAIGRYITVDMVEEDDEGRAFVTYGGKRYELGMDFLSMAMVYNTRIPENSESYHTSEEVYNEWWRLYMQRWNDMVAEIPLYSNEYYDLYNAKLSGFYTTPYRTPADAIVSATVKKGYANAVILGSVTALSGAFRNASWGKTSPAASDLDIENLTTGYATVMTDENGAFGWNLSALAEEPQKSVDDDGNLTYTLRIRRGLRFSDGSPVTAKHYLAYLLAGSTPVAVAAGGSGNVGFRILGYDAFHAYDGKNKGKRVGTTTATPYFEGVRLLDDYTFSVTYGEEYADYYYAMTYASFAPVPLALYLGAGSIETAGDGRVRLSQSFYKTEEKNAIVSYTVADSIRRNLTWDSGLPFSGPYTVSFYDEAALVATLTRNPYYEGDDVRGKPSIDTVTYVRVVSETQNDMFVSGQVDVLGGITGGTETEAALKIVANAPDKYAYSSYERAGYGKIGFRGDVGPTMFKEVRQAIMYTIDRTEFARTFTGGFGGVVHGAYYEELPAYQAVAPRMKLNRYTYSRKRAKEVLEAGGWIYNEKGEVYEEGKDRLRYKKLSGYELSEDNLRYASTDRKYRTVKIDGAYYMPLVINWYGTQPNAVTDQLISSWYRSRGSTEDIGMVIVYTSTDFTTGMGEYNRTESAGYSGTPSLSAINFATGFSSALYDFSYGWTVDPAMYDDYSRYYIRDEADYLENYE